MTLPASLLRRIGAMIYDGLLLFAILMLIAIPFVAMRGGEAVEPHTDPAFRITLIAAIFAFFVGFWVRSGRTLGMQSWRLQIVDKDAQPIRFSAAVVRFFAALVSWAPAGLGFLWQLWDKDKLSWHDRISDTRIVYVPKPKKS